MGKYSIGEFEEVVLLTVAVLFENAYGMPYDEIITVATDYTMGS